MNGIIPNLTGGGPGAQGPSLLDRGFATYGSDSGHQAAFGRGRGGPPPGSAVRRLGAQRGSDQEPRLRADEEDARRRDGAHRAHVRRAAAIQLLHRHVARRPRSADRRAALSRPTTTASRPTCRSSSFSTLMLAPELIRIHEKPLGELGDAGQGQRHSRRVHAPVRRARRPRRRHHQQLHGVPRHLRRHAGRARTGIRGRRSAARTTSIRIPTDTSANACLTDGQISTLEFVYSRYPFATPLANGAAIVRHVGAQHRSVGQRPDSERAVSRAGRRRRGRADARASRRARRDRLPDEGPVGQSARLRRRRRAQRAPAKSCRRSSTRPTPISRRSRSAAAR